MGEESSDASIGVEEFHLLQNLYEKYESYGQLSAKGTTKGLNEQKFIKLIKDLGLWEGDESEVEDVCSLHVKKGERMMFEHYVKAVIDVAKRCFPQCPSSDSALRNFISTYLRPSNETTSCSSSVTSVDTCGPYLLCVNENHLQYASTMVVPSLTNQNRLDIRLDNETLSALRSIYNHYSHHWCCSGHERTVPIRWKWSTKLCEGGFKRFIACTDVIFGREEVVEPETDVVLTGRNDTNLVCIEDRSLSTATDTLEYSMKSVIKQLKAKNGSCLSSLDFWQFVTGVASVANDQARLRSIDCATAIMEMLQRCVSCARTLNAKEATPGVYDLFEANVNKVLQANEMFLKPIFAKYASTLLAKCIRTKKLILLTSCNGSKGITPVISTTSLRKLCSEFDLIPYFTTYAKVNAYCVRKSKHPSKTPRREPRENYIDYDQMLHFLVVSSEKRLSKYPHNQIDTTCGVKIQILLKRMHCSKGMGNVFHDKYVPLRDPMAQFSRKEPKEEQVVEVEEEIHKIISETMEDSEFNVPTNMTLLNAVKGLDYFEGFKLKHRVPKTIPLNSQESRTSPNHRQSTVVPPTVKHQQRKKSVKSRQLYRIDDTAMRLMSKYDNTAPIWTGKKKTVPRVPRTKRAGTLLSTILSSPPLLHPTEDGDCKCNSSSDTTASTSSWESAHSESSLDHSFEMASSHSSYH